MFRFRLDGSSGVPPYLQLVHQVRQSLLLGYLREGDQLPTVKDVATDLVINPNTVAKAYRELEHEGIIELRQGAGAFVAANAGAHRQTEKFRAARTIVAGAVKQLRARGVTDEEIRRLYEAALAGISGKGGSNG